MSNARPGTSSAKSLRATQTYLCHPLAHPATFLLTPATRPLRPAPNRPTATPITPGVAASSPSPTTAQSAEPRSTPTSPAVHTCERWKWQWKLPSMPSTSHQHLSPQQHRLLQRPPAYLHPLPACAPHHPPKPRPVWWWCLTSTKPPSRISYATAPAMEVQVLVTPAAAAVGRQQASGCGGRSRRRGRALHLGGR